jgi:phosphoglycerate dehydrogenase-like enzyme
MSERAHPAVRVLVYTPVAADTRTCAEALRVAFPGSIHVDAAWEPADAAAMIAQAEVVMAWSFPGQLWREAGRLCWIQKLGTGVDDLRGAPLPAGVVVTNMPHVFGPWVAEYCLAYMLAFAKGVREGLRLQDQRIWRPYAPALLRDRVLGIAGLGHIGAEVARLATAFGMTVHGLRRRPAAADAAGQFVDRLYGPAQRLDFLQGLDYLVLALPETDETRGFLDEDACAVLKPGVTVINVGRGSAVVESALLDAIQHGRVRQAVLDVTSAEPLPPDNPLWTHPQVLLTPHIAGPVYVEQIPEAMAEQMGRYLRGDALLNVVDLERGY